MQGVSEQNTHHYKCKSTVIKATGPEVVRRQYRVGQAMDVLDRCCKHIDC